MKKRLSILLCIILIFQFFSLSGTKTSAATKFTLKSIVLDKKIASPGESLSVTIDFSTPDESYKVFHGVSLVFIDSNGAFRYKEADYNYKDGKFVAHIDILADEPKMSYELEQVMISYGTSVRFVNKDIDLQRFENTVLTDFSQYGFEVSGQEKDYPVIKDVSFFKQEYYSNQWAEIRVEAEWTKPLDNLAYISLSKKGYNDSVGPFSLVKTEEIFKDGVYNAVYEGRYKSYQESNWTGTWMPKSINIKGTGVNIYRYHSTTINRPFTADLSNISFTVLAERAPSPKLIGTNITNGSSNVPLTGKLELYFDKELQKAASDSHYNMKLTDGSEKAISLYREQEGNVLSLDLGSQLKANTKYTLYIAPNMIIANDGTTSETAINDFSFTTGSAASISEGIKVYITEDREFAENFNINGDLIITPGKNAVIKHGSTLEVAGDIIVYGGLINEGTINASGNIYVQKTIIEAIAGTALEKGTFVNKGSVADSNIIANSYPKPMLYITPELSGNIDASKVDFSLNTYPLLNYSINVKRGIVNKEGLQNETRTLNYGSNQLVFKVEDPFGNIEEKIISLNNTSSTIKILAAFPTHNLSKLPINTPVYFKLDREVIPGPGVNNVSLVDGNGKRVALTPMIEGNEVIFYAYNSDLAYGTKYTLRVPKDALTDTKGNFLDSEYSAVFSTDKEFTVLGGKDRSETSLKISKEGWLKSDYAVLATGNNFPDALSAAPLAAKYAAPILLVKSKELDSAIELELNRLEVKQVFIIGGTGAVSQNIEDRLKAKGIHVVRLKGKDRYETSVAIARQLDRNEYSAVFVATGENFPDALSVASVAAALQMPIILTEKTKLPEVTKKFLVEAKIYDYYIIGGYGAIWSTIGLPSNWERRISGNNRYETNLQVIAEFADKIDFTYTFFATGQNFPDALAGSALAGLYASPVILVNPNMPQDVLGAFREARGYMKMKYLLGGESVVPKALIEKITK